jgi:hypothetical protein
LVIGVTIATTKLHVLNIDKVLVRTV